MVLGAVLGPVGENAFMRTRIATGNDWTIFFREPICGTLMFGAIAALLFPFARDFVRRVRWNKKGFAAE
jgi:putative tricarboxylic transport membrane protein